MQGMKRSQSGLSMSSFLITAFLIVMGAMLAMKMVPPYIHSAQIAQVFREIVADPAMRDATTKEIEISYRKRASINDITDLQVEDITIERDGTGSLSLSAQYEVRVKLVGNISLVLEFNPASS
ncbi:MAG: DUF4845 domain-containing protein [Pseudomonadota bacterium]